MRRLTTVRWLTAMGVALVIALPVAAGSDEALAAGGPTTKTICDRHGDCFTTTCVNGVCTVTVTHPGTPGTPGGPGAASPAPSPQPDDPCAGMTGSDPATAVNPARCQAYLKSEQCLQLDHIILDGFGADSVNQLSPAQLTSMNQQLATAGCPTFTSPASEAQSALKKLVFPLPSGHRSPLETSLLHGTPYTWTSLWTYVWTDRSTWKTLTATAATPDGSVWATVTAKPVSLTFDPGDGSAPVVCNGPGRPWVESDGFNPPSAGACGYMYTKVSRAPQTATETLTWQVTWVGSGGSAGTITPPMSTKTSGQLNVLQIETVVTR